MSWRRAALFNSLLGSFCLSRLSGWLVSVMEVEGTRVFPGAVCCREGQREGKQTATRAAVLTSTGAVQCSHDGRELRKEREDRPKKAHTDGGGPVL